MIDFFTSLIKPIEWLVAWIMYGFHSLLTNLGMPTASGWTWTLSIVGLVVVMRAAMIPLFVKQIQASRKMQLIQPELQKIQKKYKGKSDPESRQSMTTETMDLYKRTGTNPFSSCLPILVQSPFFFGLFRVLYGVSGIAQGTRDPIGPITQDVATEFDQATIFGAQLSDIFLRAESWNTRIVTVILIILMSATTFMTQYQLMRKNMPASALDNPFAKQQKVLLYVLPLVFAVSGVNFPIGVLIYWFTTNLWSMTQQFYVIRRMPAPGSPAEKALQDRRKRRGKPIQEMTMPGLSSTDDAEEEEVEETKAPRQRAQPKGKKRAKKGKGKGGNVAGAGGGQTGTDKTGTDKTGTGQTGTDKTPGNTNDSGAVGSGD
ncbi:MAG: membrane protein insertase YidC [Dermatophilaceae bacterium]